ncbi:MAG: Rho termination factor N-terminal domain-containing protein, partial [Vitreimonas sp.]
MTETQALEELTSLTLQELKRKPPTEILALAESLEIEGANTLRTQDMLFSILKSVA